MSKLPSKDEVLAWISENPTLTANGIAQFSPKDRLASAKRDYDALATLLTDQRYLLGANPSAADLIVAPILAMIANLPGATEAREELRNRSDLMAYIERCQPLFKAA